jgi:hypothetical protein
MFSCIRVPEFAARIRKAHSCAHEVDEDIGIPRFVGLTPTISVDHPSPGLGNTQVPFFPRVSSDTDDEPKSVQARGGYEMAG